MPITSGNAIVPTTACNHQCFFGLIFVMWRGWRLSHKRFIMGGDDPTEDLILMAKRFEKKCQNSGKLAKKLP